MNLATPVSELNKVGKVTAKRLEILGIEKAGDLLYFFPFRYEDYSRIAPIADLKEGESVTVKGQVELIANKRSFRQRKMITEALVSDSSGSVRIVWFNQPYIAKTLKAGDTVYLSGKVSADMLGPQMISPSYEKDKGGETTHTARLVPIYPLTAGVSEKQIRYLVGQIIGLADAVPEWLPEEILEKFDLVPLAAALHGIHFPVDESDLLKSTERLKFDELFLLQLKAERARQEKKEENAPVMTFQEDMIKKFVQALPYSLTKAQKVAAWEILQDTGKGQPMNRLLSGDVGSGKTVVAAMVIYNAVLNGYQAVLLAPTEILARQHYDSVCRLLADKVTVGLLSNSQFQISNIQYPIKSKALNSKLKKEDVIKATKSGDVGVVVGTHALLSENVEFKNLGLVIVDEQHRFGVEQRKMMKNKGAGTHFLSMTATPIPRSLALMIYGDLDVSVINEMPAGRKKIISRLVEPLNRQKAYDFIRAQIKQGRQAFVICPLIENTTVIPSGVEGSLSINNADEKKTVMSEYEKLSGKIFPDLRVGFLHGKLPAQGGSASGGKPTKESVMKKFKDGEIDILVSTSVVEVGVDIPNASVMMIEGADRFGLAQLHQFRGRVGRSSHQSYCLLFTDSNSPRPIERLKYFEKENDGFKLAEKDLEMRGPGEVYGTEQSGVMNLRLAKLTDTGIIKKAREAARDVAGCLDKYPDLLKRIKEWENNVHLE